MADKIVSWGGFDSKGTSGMGVTGSLSVSGSGRFTNGLIVSGSVSMTGSYLLRGGDGSFVSSFNYTSSAYDSPTFYNFNDQYNFANSANNSTVKFYNFTPSIINTVGSFADSGRTDNNILGVAATYTATGNDSFQYQNQIRIAPSVTNYRYFNARAIYFAPTLTSISILDFRFLENTTGDSYFNTTSGVVNIGSTTGLGARLGVKGSGTTSSTTAFLVQNANASSSFSIKDNGDSTFTYPGIGGYSLKISGSYSGNGASAIYETLGASGGYYGIHEFRIGTNTANAVRAMSIVYGGRVVIGNRSDTSLQSPKANLLIDTNSVNTFSSQSFNTGIIINPSGSLDTKFTASGIQFNFGAADNDINGGAFVGSQWNPVTNGYDADLVIYNTQTNGGSYVETARFVGKSRSLSLGAGRNPSASLHISSSSNSVLLEIDSPTQNNILHVSGSGRVGIGKATDYGLEIANTSSLIISATNETFPAYSTASAAINITPHIYAPLGNRSYYSMYVGNPGVTFSGSFGNYDYRSIYTAGKIDAVGGINAGDSRFYATSNAVSFEGYNPYDGNTGTNYGGITFTGRQRIAAGDESGIGAQHVNGPRLFIYHKYNSTSTKIIFSIAGSIRSTYFGNGNLSIGNGETDMSARLGVKGSGTTSSTTSFLVQNANASSSLLVQDGVSVSGFQVTAGNFTDSTFYRDSLWRSATLASARDITVGSDGTLNGYSSRLNFINYYSNGGQGNQSNFAGYLRTSIGQYTATGGPGGNQNSGRGTLLLGVYDSDYSSTVLNSFDVVSVGKYATTISGSVTVSSILTLTPQSPLPSGVPTGSFAVSSSVPPKPYFYDGTAWNALY